MSRLDPRVGLVLATWFRIFLLGVQTQNVMGGLYAWSIITTAGLAFADVAIVIQVMQSKWKAVPWVFLGGAAGVTSAMYFHRLWIG
jgi:hypothetical protein